MVPAFARTRRFALAFWTALGAYLLSPLAPAVSADAGEGLGAGGAAFAINYTVVIGIVLAFIFGFGLRDYIQKRILRTQAAKKHTQASPRT